MESCLRRFLQSIEHLRDNGVIHTQTDIANNLGMSRSRISEAVKGVPKRFTMGFVKKFADAYGDYINPEWLYTGEGEMERKDPRKYKPNIPIRVAAGFVGGCVEEALISGCEMLPTLPLQQAYDFTIRVMGDSMSPTIEADDLIACRYIDSLEEIKEDKIYVVDTREGAVVKKLRLNNTELVCISINPKYETYTIKTSAVIKAAQVVGTLRNY
jgi:SOS-response transcriptional repressor LexA